MLHKLELIEIPRVRGREQVAQVPITRILQFPVIEHAITVSECSQNSKDPLKSVGCPSTT